MVAQAGEARLTLFGRKGEVTGSCYLLACAAGRLLLECGLFQGDDEVEALNGEPFAFRAGDIDAVILSHAHLDHSGLLPRLVREGFRGPVYATAPTRDLAALLWRDAVNVQQIRGAPELYDINDVLRAWRSVRTLPYGTGFEPLPGCTATLLDAGHILGSASVHVCLPTRAGTVALGFSGDLGNPQAAFMRPAVPPPAADALILESTYGDREHPPQDEALERLAHILAEAHARRGNVIIPCFAVARTQEMLFHLGELHRRGQLPQEAVYLDSPLAIEATRVYEHYADWWAQAQRGAFRAAGVNGFRGWLPPLRLSYTGAASRAINDVDSGAVIIAGSGMCSGGRVLHHLRRHLHDPRHQVVLVGFQAPETLGRALHDGADEVELFGEVHPVRARIHTLAAFSAHAGQSALRRWAEAAHAQRIFLVHGEPGPMQSLQACVAEVSRGDVIVGERGQPYVLG